MNDKVNAKLRYFIFKSAAADDIHASALFYEELRGRDFGMAQRVASELAAMAMRGEL